ncbi:hypothetical protein RCL1_004505 [Eukaryota sp. TZLM3-RCL]
MLSLLEDLKCPISLDLMLDPVTLQCGHSFGRSVLREYLNDENRCPYCRSEIPEGFSGVQVFLLKKMISAVFCPKFIKSDELADISRSSQFLIRHSSDGVYQPMIYNDRKVLWKRPKIPLSIEHTSNFDLDTIISKDSDSLRTTAVRRLIASAGLVRHVDSPFCLKVFGVTVPELGIVMEASGPSITQLLEKGVVFSTLVWRKILYQCCAGLKAFHDSNIIHCAFSTDCVFVSVGEDESVEVKIGNPGTSIISNEIYPEQPATALFFPPRCELPTHAVSSIDMYSLGVLFYVFFTDNFKLLVPPFKQEVLEFDFTDLDSEVSDLLQSMLDPEQHNRPSCSDVMTSLLSIFSCEEKDLLCCEEYNSSKILREVLNEKDKEIKEKETCIQKLYIEHTIQVNGMHETTKRIQEANEDLRSKIEDHEVTIYQHFKQKQSLENQIQKLKAKLDESLLQNEVIRAARAELHSKIQERDTTLVENQARITKLCQDTKQQLQQVSDLNKKLTESNETIQNLQTFEQTQKKLIQDLKKQLEEVKVREDRSRNVTAYTNRLITNQLHNVLSMLNPGASYQQPSIDEVPIVQLQCEAKAKKRYSTARRARKL